jgi:hypothetical protein
MQLYLTLARLLDRAASAPRPAARRGPPPAAPDRASHAELLDACRRTARALRGRARRAGRPREERERARARARELEEVVVHHPLRDDLIRALAAARAEWPDLRGAGAP